MIGKIKSSRSSNTRKNYFNNKYFFDSNSNSIRSQIELLDQYQNKYENFEDFQKHMEKNHKEQFGILPLSLYASYDFYPIKDTLSNLYKLINLKLIYPTDIDLSNFSLKLYHYHPTKLSSNLLIMLGPISNELLNYLVDMFSFMYYLPTNINKIQGLKDRIKSIDLYNSMGGVGYLLYSFLFILNYVSKENILKIIDIITSLYFAIFILIKNDCPNNLPLSLKTSIIGIYSEICKLKCTEENDLVNMINSDYKNITPVPWNQEYNSDGKVKIFIATKRKKYNEIYVYLKHPQNLQECILSGSSLSTYLKLIEGKVIYKRFISYYYKNGIRYKASLNKDILEDYELYLDFNINKCYFEKHGNWICQSVFPKIIHQEYPSHSFDKNDRIFILLMNVHTDEYFKTLYKNIYNMVIDCYVFLISKLDNIGSLTSVNFLTAKAINENYFHILLNYIVSYNIEVNSVILKQCKISLNYNTYQFNTMNTQRDLLVNLIMRVITLIIRNEMRCYKYNKGLYISNSCLDDTNVYKFILSKLDKVHNYVYFNYLCHCLHYGILLEPFNHESRYLYNLITTCIDSIIVLSL